MILRIRVCSVRVPRLSKVLTRDRDRRVAAAHPIWIHQ